MGLIAVFWEQNLAAFHVIILTLTHLQVVAVGRDCLFHRGTIEESPLQLHIIRQLAVHIAHEFSCCHIGKPLRWNRMHMIFELPLQKFLPATQIKLYILLVCFQCINASI